MRFDELLYNDALLDALDAMHFEECTPIQEQAIPVAEQGRDLIAVAQTGTGKTAAYVLPVLDQLADGGYPDDAVNCVIMAPTRELVQQIDRQIQGFSYFLPFNAVAIYGGTDGKVFDQQKRGLTQGADIVVATPGRLLAHLQMGYVDLKRVSFFILDEADRMLDMGFFDDIMKVVKELPDNRQTLMFSATMPPKIKQLAKQILTDPVEVKIAINKPAERVEQSAYVVYERQKEALLVSLFRQTPPDRVIVFSSSKLKVKQLARALRGHGIPVAEMHSDLEQDRRDEVMLDFRAGRVKVLVATDVVSRGIDIDDISLVVNYDVPHAAEDYVHRVGRTARAAGSGRAITFISEKEQRKFRDIERLIEREVEKAELPADLGSGPEYSGTRAHNDGRGRGRGRNDRPRRRNEKKAPKKTAENATPSPEPKKEKKAKAQQQPEQPTAAKKKRRHRRRGGKKPGQAPAADNNN